MCSFLKRILLWETSPSVKGPQPHILSPEADGALKDMKETSVAKDGK